MDRYQQTIKAYDALAQQYADKFSDVSLYAPSINRFLDELPAKAKVLEPGCGPGNCTHYMLSQRDGLDITGTDMAPNMIALAQAKNPSAAYLQMDCREIHEAEGPFEGIFCSFAIPYLSESDNLNMMTGFHRLLPPGGALYISFIEGNPDDSGYQSSSDGTQQTFVHYYTEDFFTAAMAQTGFVPVETFRIAYSRSNGPEYHLAMVYRKI